MNRKKMKIIVILCALLLLLSVSILTILDNFLHNRKNNNVKDNEVYMGGDSSYSFNQTIDLDNEELDTIYEPELGTENPEIGTISNYYDKSNIENHDGKLYLPSYDGEDIIATSWINEGFATYIEEPQFGDIEKFILSDESISASFINVKMRDAISYINRNAGLGFTNVKLNDRNDKYDYYNYSATKDDVTFTLNYEKGRMLITSY